MKINKLKNSDINTVIDLWYDASIKAHHFISSEYWNMNKITMATKYLPNSETYLAIENNDIVGFIAMADNYLAAVFVKTSMQGHGIGTQLLNYIKNRRSLIELKVYKKNFESVKFYKKQNFKFVSEEVEEETGEIESYMRWTK